MTDIENIWQIIWPIIKDIILPHTGTLILNIILLVLLGTILSTIYTVFLFKKGFFKRKQKYYNWWVKLYIPLLIIGFTYIFGQIGFIRGSYKIILKEKDMVVSGIYFYFFGTSSESEKNIKNSILVLQDFAKVGQKGSVDIAEILANFSEQNNIGVPIIDSGKNKLSVYILEKHKDDIFKVIIYGLLRPNIPKITSSKRISYEEFSNAFNILTTSNIEELQKSIRSEITVWTSNLFRIQYQSLVISNIFLILLISVIPLIDFFIYQKWILTNKTYKDRLIK